MTEDILRRLICLLFFYINYLLNSQKLKITIYYVGFI